MKNKTSIRTLTALALIVVVCVGLAFHTGIGTPSTFGFLNLAAICPLGAIESAIASKIFVPQAFVGLVVSLLLIFIFGRAFCGWFCPVPLLNRIIKGGKKPKAGNKEELQADDTNNVEAGLKAASDGCLGDDVQGAQSNVETAAVHDSEGASALDVPANQESAAVPFHKDSRNYILGASIVTTAVFGFPVFCLICPVGLTFATIIAVWQIFQFGNASFSALVFPAIIIVEIVFLRKWCHKFCPLGAIMSLLGRLNRTFRPSINSETCLHAKSQKCSACAKACPEKINMHKPEVSRGMHECVRCGKCQHACPTNSITFPFLSKKNKDSEKYLRSNDEK